MSISHRSNRLKLVGSPSVEKLQNGRFRLTFNLSPLNPRNDWYNANKDRIFADYGTLQSAEMSIDGIAPRTGEAYGDMALVNAQSAQSGDDYVVQFTYETLGDTFIQIKDDTISYTENGLRRVTRESIAAAGTDFQKTVGTSTISSQIDDETAVTCYLASYEVDDTDSSRKVTEVYIEAGTLSRTEDFVGSQDSLVIEAIGPDPSTPDGFSLASKQESNFEGFQTNRFTFLKDDVKLSQTEDKVGSQLAISQQWFNPAADKTLSGYSLARTEESDVDGIPTKQYTFLKPSILSVQQEFNETRDRITVRAFGLLDEDVNLALEEVTANHKLIAQSEDDFQGIKTSTYVYELDSHDIISTEENGLRTVTRSLILAAGTDYDKVVGTDSITHKIDPTDSAVTLYLAGFSIKDTSEFRVITEVYIEAGILSEVTEPGPVPGTVQVTRVSVGVESVPAGALISFRDERNNGYTTFTRTTIQGTITGVKQTYKDVVEVQVPGLVTLTSSSDVATLNVTPIRTKKVAATVTVQIVSTPTNTAQVAYDLSNVSCSVTATNVSDKTGPGNTVTAVDGNTSVTSSGFTRTKNVSARVLNYPGHYYSAASNPTTDVISYVSARVMRASGSSIGSDDYNATTTTSLKASGLGSEPGESEGYYTTGVLRRRNRPILTTFQSASNPVPTEYFEEITWSV